jgi:hypothetical protein
MINASQRESADRTSRKLFLRLNFTSFVSATSFFNRISPPIYSWLY